MKNRTDILRLLPAAVCSALLALLLSACSAESETNESTSSERAGIKGPVSTKLTSLDVYKSPTCGCCESWIEHLGKDDFDLAIHHPQDMLEVKNRYGIASEFQSCHTAVSTDGYVFEGHVPEKFIKRFLAEKPAGAIGLAVPAMPIGSPGMEMEDRFTPYQVLLLLADGGSSVYAEIGAADQQY